MRASSSVSRLLWKRYLPDQHSPQTHAQGKSNPETRNIHSQKTLCRMKTDPLTQLQRAARTRPPRGEVETTTGLIRVRVDVQMETPRRWIAHVFGQPYNVVGETRKEAIRTALRMASVKPVSKK